MIKNPIVEEFFKRTLHHISDGASIDEMQAILEDYEEQEDYLECAGIKMALDFVRFNTLIAVARKLKED